jgi:hypothetical protein
MKFALIFALCLAPIVGGVELNHIREEAAELDAATVLGQQAAEACGASGSCHGFGGEELCHDRCKHCYGPSGYYHRGNCCGLYVFF